MHVPGACGNVVAGVLIRVFPAFNIENKHYHFVLVDLVEKSIRTYPEAVHIPVFPLQLLDVTAVEGVCPEQGIHIIGDFGIEG